MSAADRYPGAGDAATFGVTWALRQIPGIIKGPRNVRDSEAAALRAAGFDIYRWNRGGTPQPRPRGGKFVPVWYNPVTGVQLSRSEAVAYAGQLRAGTAQPPAVIPRPPPVVNPPVPYEPPPNQPPPWNPPPINRGPPTGGAGTPPFVPPIVGTYDLGKVFEQLSKWNDLLTGGLYTAVFGPPPIPKGPTNPRGPRPGSDPGRGDPFPPGGSPPQVIVIKETPPAPRETAAESRARARAQARVGLGDIFVTKKRLPMPAPVPPSAPTLPKWLQLAQLAAPILLPLILPRAQTNVKFSDPLTQPPFEEPIFGYQPEVANYYGGDFGGGAVGTNTCECKPPRKKRRKKKRTKCYTGRFTETATGTSKYSKREVPCK